MWKSKQTQQAVWVSHKKQVHRWVKRKLKICFKVNKKYTQQCHSKWSQAIGWKITFFRIICARTWASRIWDLRISPTRKRRQNSPSLKHITAFLENRSVVLRFLARASFANIKPTYGQERKDSRWHHKTVEVEIASVVTLELDILTVRTRESGGVSTNST